ncbi:hypothetical protein EU528_05870 [Candidatus Thorarchaeota archaeon]|nr:MAG: hypothetical protein EU528_05870 [Candidatus Thorarchaeota archaeon]
MSKKSTTSDYSKLERKFLKPLQQIAWDIDSPNLGTMYEAVGKLATVQYNRLLLPKAMDLLDSPDRNVKQAAYTVAGKNMYGDYLSEFTIALKEMNPAEREQVLQGIHEAFSQTGGPTSAAEQKNWIKSFETLGKEHQPSVFGLMIGLGKLGVSWVTKQIRDDIKGVTLGSVPRISMFPERERKKLIKLLCNGAAKHRRDLIPYICGIVDEKTVKYLSVFLRNSEWQERVEIAEAVARNGIQTSSGLVMELVADSKWQVKQGLLDNLNLQSSKLTPLLTVLSHLMAESHSRVRGQAERTLLLLGTTACDGSNIKEQRKRLEKQFRSQLLKATRTNKDIDVRWLGIERDPSDPMIDIMKKISPILDQPDSSDTAGPEGVSLADFSKGEKTDTPDADEQKLTEKDKSVLLSALLGAQKSSEEVPPVVIDEPSPKEYDPTIPASSRFILALQKTSKEIGKDVPIDILQAECEKAGLTEKEFVKSLGELEEQGIIYRSSKKTVSYADIDL